MLLLSLRQIETKCYQTARSALRDLSFHKKCCQTKLLLEQHRPGLIALCRRPREHHARAATCRRPSHARGGAAHPVGRSQLGMRNRPWSLLLLCPCRSALLWRPRQMRTQRPIQITSTLLRFALLASLLQLIPSPLDNGTDSGSFFACSWRMLRSCTA